MIIEGEGSPAPATMVITRLHVLDVNEHAPAFHSQPYVVHLAENAPPHTSVVQRECSLLLCVLHACSHVLSRVCVRACVTQ